MNTIASFDENIYTVAYAGVQKGTCVTLLNGRIVYAGRIQEAPERGEGLLMLLHEEDFQSLASACCQLGIPPTVLTEKATAGLLTATDEAAQRIVPRETLLCIRDELLTILLQYAQDDIALDLFFAQGGILVKGLSLRTQEQLGFFITPHELNTGTYRSIFPENIRNLVSILEQGSVGFMPSANERTC